MRRFAVILVALFLAVSTLFIPPSHATVAVETTKSGPYAGTGTTGPFAYSFKVFAAADLEVIQYDSAGTPTTLTYATDYTVTGVGLTAGGTVTLTTALPVGSSLVIRRHMDYLQSQNYTTVASISPANLNNTFDKLEMQIQQVNEKADRSFQLPVDTTLATPYLKPQAGYVLGWNALGTGLKNYATTAVSVPELDHIGNYADSLNTAVSTIGASPQVLYINKAVTLTGNVTVPSTLKLVVEKGGSITTTGYTLTINGPFEAGPYQVFAGTGTVVFGVGSVQAAYPQWAGAVGDGVTDSTVAITKWLGWNCRKRVPRGTYIINTASTLSTSVDQDIEFDDGAIFDASGSNISGVGLPVFLMQGSIGTFYALGNSPAVGANTFTAHATLAASLSKGDLIQFTSDTVAGGSGTLFESSRAYYWIGEIAEVESVSGTTVTLKRELYGAYTTSDVCAKITPIKVSLKNFTLLGTVNNRDIGVKILYGNGVRVSGGNISQFGQTLLELFSCYNFLVDGFTGSNIDTTTGSGYGLGIMSCVKGIVTNNRIASYLVAIEMGGEEPVTDVLICNNIVGKSPSSGGQAISTHGNTRYIDIIDNIVSGGIKASGINTAIVGNTLNGVNTASSGKGSLKYVPEGSFADINRYIHIKNNKVQRGLVVSTETAISIGLVTQTYPIEELVIEGNECDQGLAITWGANVAAERLRINRNGLKGTYGGITLTRSTGSYTLTVSKSFEIVGNQLEGNSQVAYVVADVLDFSRNKMFLNDSATYPIYIYSAANVIQDITFHGNYIKGGSGITNPVRLTTARSLSVVGNTVVGIPSTGGFSLISVNTLFTGNQTVSCTGTVSISGRYYSQIFGNGNVVSWGTAAPIAGAWIQGDRSLNTAATVGQPKAWICTVAGTPGTWVSEGNL